MILTQREKEIIYFALSRQLDDKTMTEKEWEEVDELRDQFYTGDAMPTLGGK